MPPYRFDVCFRHTPLQEIRRSRRVSIHLVCMHPFINATEYLVGRQHPFGFELVTQIVYDSCDAIELWGAVRTNTEYWIATSIYYLYVR